MLHQFSSKYLFPTYCGLVSNCPQCPLLPAWGGPETEEILIGPGLGQSMEKSWKTSPKMRIWKGHRLKKKQNKTCFKMWDRRPVPAPQRGLLGGVRRVPGAGRKKEESSPSPLMLGLPSLHGLLHVSFCFPPPTMLFQSGWGIRALTVPWGKWIAWRRAFMNPRNWVLLVFYGTHIAYPGSPCLAGLPSRICDHNEWFFPSSLFWIRTISLPFSLQI